MQASMPGQNIWTLASPPTNGKFVGTRNRLEYCMVGTATPFIVWLTVIVDQKWLVDERRNLLTLPYSRGQAKSTTFVSEPSAR